MNNSATPLILASRWARFLASTIDGILGAMILVVFMSKLGAFEYIESGDLLPIELLVKIAVSSWLIFFLLNGHLLSRYGQTIGKRVMGIAIVTLDGQKPQFWPLVVKRYLVIGLLSYIPLLGTFLNITNGLFIFRRDKRCVHDLIAGTIVVMAQAKSVGPKDTLSA